MHCSSAMRSVVPAVFSILLVTAAQAQTPRSMFYDFQEFPWITDGTAPGTERFFTPIDPGYSNSGLRGPLVTLSDGRLMFVILEDSDDFINFSHEVFFTDGTQAGTSHISVPETGADILASNASAEIGGKVLMLQSFNSEVGQPVTLGFVLTDGTEAGTSTFTAPGPPLPFEFSYGPMVGIGNKALFNGTDLGGKQSLWVSDGTTAGTMPLAISGAATDGLDPTTLTALGTKALFTAIDSSGHQNLWVTDGTVAGTIEIPQDVADPGFPDETVFVANLTVAGNQGFFTNLGSGLFVTNGTVAGTQQITVPGLPPNSNASISSIVPRGNGVVAFGNDNNFNNAIFVSDGTSAGSSEFTWSGNTPQGFTVLGNKILFEATDSQDIKGLWITDGTAAGTEEIEIPNAYSLGVFFDIPFGEFFSGGGVSNNLTAIGNKVTFAGEDILGRFGVWVTDGTSAGTIELTTIVDPGSFSPQVVATAVPTALVAAVLPGSRSVEVGNPATIFATMINSGPSALDDCQIQLPQNVTAGLTLSYQTTDPASNTPTGAPDTPVTIAGNGGAQSFILSFTGTTPFTEPALPLAFSCAGTGPAAVTPGVDTVDLSISSTAVADIITGAVTATDNGIIEVPNGGATAFAVASVNIGAEDFITVSADTGSASLPLTLSICQTDPTSGQCMAAPAAHVSLEYPSQATPTFSVFLQATGAIPFSPGTSRVFVRFEDGNGGFHGSTSLAIETE
jgi:hypothetical protein